MSDMHQFPNLPLKSRLPSKGEFKVYSSYDLDELFGSQADSFMFRTAVRMESFLNARLFMDMDSLWKTMTNHQKAEYKYALMEQMIYVIVRGDYSVVGNDDGNIDVRKIIAPEAKQHLMNCGIWSTKVKAYGRDGIGLFKNGGQFYD